MLQTLYKRQDKGQEPLEGKKKKNTHSMRKCILLIIGSVISHRAHQEDISKTASLLLNGA